MTDKENIIAEVVRYKNDIIKEETVSEDLDEAADAYNEEYSKYLYGLNTAFKAGANWQKQQMMGNAITAHCFGFQSGKALFTFKQPAESYLVNSELKVIIVKENTQTV